MGEATHDGDEQFAFRVQGPNVFFLKEHFDACFFELAHMRERVDGVAGETRDTLGEDQVDIAAQGVGDHLLEPCPVFRGGTRDALISVDTY